MKKQILTVLAAAALLAGCANLCEMDRPCSAKKADITLDATLFAFDSSVLSPKAEDALDKVAKELKKTNKAAKITGYTDVTGNAAYNVQLSRDRAQSVAKYLEAKGVNKNKLTTEGLGATNFVATNNTAAGRAQNRRVDIVLE